MVQNPQILNLQWCVIVEEKAFKSSLFRESAKNSVLFSISQLFIYFLTNWCSWAGIRQTWWLKMHLSWSLLGNEQRGTVDPLIWGNCNWQFCLWFKFDAEEASGSRTGFEPRKTRRPRRWKRLLSLRINMLIISQVDRCLPHWSRFPQGNLGSKLLPDQDLNRGHCSTRPLPTELNGPQPHNIITLSMCYQIVYGTSIVLCYFYFVSRTSKYF